MTSVQNAIRLDGTLHTADLPNIYQEYRRSHMRKHYQDVDETILKRNEPILEKIWIPAEDSINYRRLKSPRTPLSPNSALLTEAASFVALRKSSLSRKPVTLKKEQANTHEQFPPLKELFVSPHPDDICYSCFSTVSQGKKDDQPAITKIDKSRVIVTVFSKSRCANGDLGEKLKRNVEDISKVRKTEDEQFAQTVGCALYSLGLPDSSARDEFSRWTHLAEQDVYEQHRVVKLHPRYQEAQRALTPIVRWAVQCRASIYMPLAIGCHVDHLMTRIAVTCILDDMKVELKTSKLPINLTYYEDLPYAYYVTEQSIQQLALNVLPKNAKSSLIEVDRECWEKKRQAVLAYATQMKPIILPALHERALTLASFEADDCTNERGTGLRERIWTV